MSQRPETGDTMFSWADLVGHGYADACFRLNHILQVNHNNAILLNKYSFLPILQCLGTDVHAASGISAIARSSLLLLSMIASSPMEEMSQAHSPPTIPTTASSLPRSTHSSPNTSPKWMPLSSEQAWKPSWQSRAKATHTSKAQA